MRAVELFCCGGGASLGARSAGVETVGIDVDRWACRTHQAAGFPTIRADVGVYPPERFAGYDGIWASPPCPDFSRAGKRAGLAGTTGYLVWEPLRWAEIIRPAWVCCEQVPDVLPIWRHIAAGLRAIGYSVWCGLLDAADYGVPQNRVRAILIAVRAPAVAAPPPPTHSQHAQPASMFGPGTDRWVSMAEALGWCSFMLHTNRDQRPDGTRQTVSADRPPVSVTGRSGTQWQLHTVAHDRSGDGSIPRTGAQPAPTIAIGHGLAQWCWERPATTIMGDPRVFPAGGHHPETGDPSWSTRAVRVTLDELAALQAFPPGHPFAGNKTQVASQIGNAVPPPLAAAIIGAAVASLAARECAA